MKSIPQEQQEEFLVDTIKDRIVNLLAVALCEPRAKWIHHSFYTELREDMKKVGVTFTLKQKFFLFLLNHGLRQLYILLSKKIHSGE